MNVKSCISSKLNSELTHELTKPNVINRKDLSSTGNDIKLVIRASCHLKDDNGTL